MTTVLQATLDHTEQPGTVASATWGEIRPCFAGPEEREQVAAFADWCAQNGREAVATHVPEDETRSNAAVITVIRIQEKS